MWFCMMLNSTISWSTNQPIVKFMPAWSGICCTTSHGRIQYISSLLQSPVDWLGAIETCIPTRCIPIQVPSEKKNVQIDLFRKKIYIGIAWLWACFYIGLSRFWFITLLEKTHILCRLFFFAIHQIHWESVDLWIILFTITFQDAWWNMHGTM